MWRQTALPKDVLWLRSPAIASTATNVYLFGGVIADQERPNQATTLWRLDLASGLWFGHEAFRGGGNATPAATSGHTLVAMRGHLYLLGARRSSSLSAPPHTPIHDVTSTAFGALQPDRDSAEESADSPSASPDLWSVEQPEGTPQLWEGGDDFPAPPLKWRRDATPPWVMDVP